MRNVFQYVRRGATITYAYSMFDGVSWGGSSNEYPSRWLTSKTSSAGLWTYSPAVTSGAGTGNGCLGGYEVGCMNVQVNRPDGSFEITSFIVDPYGGSWPQVIQSKGSSGTVLSTVNNTWDFSNACTLNLCGGKGYQDVRKLSTSTTIPVPTGNITKQTTYAYDTPQTANITQIKKWKYQSGTFPSIPDRATYLTYKTIGTNNDINHPTIIAVCNSVGTDPDCPGGGSKVAKTTINYDGYGTNGSLALTSTQANVTGVFNHDDTDFGSSYTTRGNATLISRWVSGTSSGVTCGSTCLTTAVSYDITGQVIQLLDSNSNRTTYSYGDVFYSDNGANPPASFTPTNSSGVTITTNAYLTSVTDNIGRTSAGYYYGSGNPATATDYNSLSTYSHYVNSSDIQDPFDRLMETVYPIGWSLNTYTSPTQFDSYAAIGSATASTGCTSCLHTEALLDTLGRITNQSLANNPSGQSYETATYDSLNRAATVSHPNFGVTDPNDVVETPHYDGLSRSLGVTHPDGESTQIAYGASVTALGGLSAQQGSGYGVGFPVLSVDEAGNLRQEWLDGFGRVIEVDEPSVAGKLTSPFVTNYTYDALGNLTSVLQGVQTRTYQYDGLSRLTMEQTPEASTTTNGVTVQNPVSWSYVTAGGVLCSGNPSNPCSKTDARGIVTTYAYYTSNLLRQKTHSDTTGTEVYTYGTSAPNLGRLTEMTDPSGSETYTYDSMGRVTSLAKVIGSTTYNIGYQYNAGGQLTQVTYPSGRNVYYVYDNVGHLCLVSAISATSCSSSSPYLTIPSTAYDAANRPRTAIYGNGMVAAAVYSPQRSQLLSLSYGGGTLSTSVVGTISCSSVPVTCEATVTSSAGFNTADTITISGNNNSLLNGSFTVDVVSSGTTILFYAANSLAGITGSGGTLTGKTSGTSLSTSIVGTISCTSAPVNCEATVTSSAGFNAMDTITISGNSNSLLNGSFTVDAISSGTTILFYAANSLAGITGSGGTLSSGTFLSTGIAGTISCTSVPVTCEATVPSSTGFNATDTISISGNSNSLLNSSFTVRGTSSTTVVFYAANSLSGITGSGGTITDDNSPGAPLLLGLNYYYQQDSTNCPKGNTLNNGQIQCIVDVSTGAGDSGRSLAYTYDSLGRLLTANTTGSTQYPAWGLSWTYDRYSNRTAQNVTAGNGYTSLLTINSANNQVTSPAYTYDAAGNVTAIPGTGAATYTYDGEECNTGFTGNEAAAYTCDGKELRVKKVITGGTTTVYIRSGGQVIAEYDNGAAVNSPTREYLYGNHLLAIVTGSTSGSGGTITYQHRDTLSPRLYTNSSGGDSGEQGTYPFGEPWYNNTTSSWVFTTYERDAESGNDYALARSYASTNGRFLSPDPLEGIVGDPQSWNRYAYVENDPIDLTDPSGQGFWQDLGHDLENLWINFTVGYAVQAISAGLPSPSSLPCRNIACTQPPPFVIMSQNGTQGGGQDPNAQDPSDTQEPPTTGLPNDPSELGPEWKDVTPGDRTKNPKIPQRFEGPNGVQVEFDPAKPDAPRGTHGERGHWHEVDPTGHRVGDYLPPGSPFPQPAPAPSAPNPVRRIGDFVSAHRTAITVGIVIGAAVVLAPETGGASLVVLWVP